MMASLKQQQILFSHIFEKKKISLSNFPSAGILLSVPTSSKSLPIESILFDPVTMPIEPSQHWFCDANDEEIQIVIVLGYQSAVVTHLRLLVDSQG